MHRAVASHPLATQQLGGAAGYKTGAVGAEGEFCWHAPIFRSFVVDASAGGQDLSCAAVNAHQIEPEIGVTLLHGLPARADGALHTPADVLRATKEISLCLEVCGSRVDPGLKPSLSRMASSEACLPPVARCPSPLHASAKPLAQA